MRPPEATLTASKTEKASAAREPSTLNDRPKEATDSTESDAPTCIEPEDETKDPQWVGPATTAELPVLRHDPTERAPPILQSAAVEMEEPKKLKSVDETMAEPTMTFPATERSDASLVEIPETEIPDPIRLALRIDSPPSQFTRPFTDNWPES